MRFYLCSLQFKAGSKERGSVWTEIANSLNGHPWFIVTQQDVRNRFILLEKKAKKRLRNIKTSGVSPEDTELDLALEEMYDKGFCLRYALINFANPRVLPLRQSTECLKQRKKK